MLHPAIAEAKTTAIAQNTVSLTTNKGLRASRADVEAADDALDAFHIFRHALGQ